MNDDLGVAVCAEAVTAGDQTLTQGSVIVDLAVKHDPDRAVFVTDRLMASDKINDAEAAHAQPNAALHVSPLIIGTAMKHGITHPPQEIGIDLSARFKPQYACYPTHFFLSQ